MSVMPSRSSGQEPLRVCFMANNLNPGGLERVVLNLIKGLDTQRFESHLICLDGEGLLFPEVPLPPERCLVLEKTHSVNLLVARFNPSNILRIARFFREHSIQLAHLHNAGPLIYGGLAARLATPRPVVVYSEHNQVYSASRFSKLKFRLYLRSADAIVAVSDDLRRTLQRSFSPGAPIEVIANGVDGSRHATARTGTLRTLLGIGERDRIVGTVAALSRQKGLVHLLDAVPRILAARPDVRIVVVGDGPLREDLVAHARAAGVGDRVSFVGYRTDVPECIADFDLFVLPSLWEGHPLVLLEALAAGKPIVATNVGGNPEIVTDGANGFIVPPRDAPALADRIVRLLNDHELSGRMGAANRALFASRFTVGATIEAHERLFSRLAASSR